MKVKNNLPIMIVLSAAVLLPMGANARVSVSDLQLSDGVIIIDQERALAGNVTPGDAAGFPVTISQSGSYRLAGNLTATDPNTDVIELTTNEVTLDLNGFVIFGTGAATGTGEGIATPPGVGGNSTIVSNGIIRGMGSNGIRLDSKCRIENIQVIVNGGDGINVTTGAQILNSIANDNIGDGIETSHDSLVKDSEAAENEGNGIVTGSRCLVVDNIANRNNGDGITLGAACTVKGNAAGLNGGNGIKGVEAAGASLILANTANNNTNDGIHAGAGSTLKDNTASQNGDDGIDAFAASLVLGNSATANTNFGLRLGGRVGYGHNAIVDNNGPSGNNNPQVFSGIEIDTNLCGTDTVCP